jgi:hypothetical protein
VKACIKYNVETIARLAKRSDRIREYAGPFLTRSGMIGSGVRTRAEKNMTSFILNITFDCTAPGRGQVWDHVTGWPVIEEPRAPTNGDAD